MQRARLEVEAFFPKSTSDAYKLALHAVVSLDRNPNTEFTEKSVAAVKMMAADIGLLEEQTTPWGWCDPSLSPKARRASPDQQASRNALLEGSHRRRE